MSYKYLKTIIVFGSLLLFASLLALGWFLRGSSDPLTKQTEQEAQNSLDKAISSSEVGYYSQAYFELSYLEDGQIYVLTIKESPFLATVDKAKTYLKTQGINFDKVKYICSVTPNVTDATEKQVTGCGNTTLQQ